VERIGILPSAMALLYRTGGDDRNLQLWKIDTDKVITTRWELATGRETVLDESENNQTASRTSPDERRLVRANRYQIAVKPVAGGSWQTLASTPNLQLAITADSNWILYHAADSAGNQALFRVPTTGGASERLGSFPSSSYLGSMEISNDGRHIVTASYDYGHGFELWALDNFMPTTSKR
jgi:WD40 repeat protein